MSLKEDTEFLTLQRPQTTDTRNVDELGGVFFVIDSSVLLFNIPKHW